MNKRFGITLFCGLALLAAGAGGYHLFRSAPGAPGALAALSDKAPGASAPGGPASAGAAPAGGNPAAKQAGPGGPGGAAAMPVAVEVVTVSTTSVRDEIFSVGTLRSNESVVIRTEVAGRVARVGFTDGQTVAKGTVLVQFDDSVVRAEWAQAKAELELARENFRRVEDLRQKNFVSASALDQAAASRDVAQSKVDLALARLQRYTLVAPFAGTVGLRNVTPGDYIKEGADVVSLEDLSSMRLDFRLPEKFVPALKPGNRLTADFEAFPGKSFAASVVAVDPQIDPAGRSALLRARLPNPGQILKPGMLAKVSLDMGERTNTVVIPEESIVPQGGDAYVYRVIDGKAVKTQVRLGRREKGQVEITSGLAAGEQIVVAGQMRIGRDQAPVRVVGGGAS